MCRGVYSALVVDWGSVIFYGGPHGLEVAIEEERVETAWRDGGFDERGKREGVSGFGGEVEGSWVVGVSGFGVAEGPGHFALSCEWGFREGRNGLGSLEELTMWFSIWRES